MPLSLQLEGQSKAQLAVSLAALLLSDSKVEITADNLNTGTFVIFLYNYSNNNSHM